MSSILLHANMYTNYVQESQSQAKLQKALDRNKKSSIAEAPLSQYELSPSAPNFNDNATLMMREPGTIIDHVMINFLWDFVEHFP
ncbi:hypothetical protein F5880DRAFT_1615218 [Lentinula raphanica]|nr:hypothetical protein F5880DRAFT_1615218 [Lentinula raphanica]